MALKTPYATIEQANGYLSDNDAWTNLSTTEKDTHLINGRYYIDSNYECSEEVDMTAIDEEYVYANSLLASYDMVESVYSVNVTGNSPVVKKKVKAGTVESETTYAGSRSTTLRIGGIDQYPAITSILSSFCSRKRGSDIKSVVLLRS